MMKMCIGLGVLSIPATFDYFGIVPGTLCLVAIGGISTWSCCIVGSFKLRHPEVYAIDDAGYLMFGPIGREVFAVAFCLCEFLVAIIPSHQAKTLTSKFDRLHLRRWIWHARYFNRPQCSLNARRLHVYLRRCGGHRHLCACQYSNPW